MASGTRHHSTAGTFNVLLAGEACSDLHTRNVLAKNAASDGLLAAVSHRHFAPRRQRPRKTAPGHSPRHPTAAAGVGAVSPEVTRVASSY